MVNNGIKGITVYTKNSQIEGFESEKDNKDNKDNKDITQVLYTENTEYTDYVCLCGKKYNHRATLYNHKPITSFTRV